MKDILVKSDHREFTHIRHNGQVFQRDRRTLPRYEVFQREYLEDEQTFIRYRDKSGGIHFEAMASTADLLGVEFLVIRPAISVSFQAEIVPLKTHTTDSHGHESEVVDQWCIPLPKGAISNPENMRVTVDILEILDREEK